MEKGRMVLTHLSQDKMQPLDMPGGGKPCPAEGEHRLGGDDLATELSYDQGLTLTEK